MHPRCGRPFSRDGEHGIGLGGPKLASGVFKRRNRLRGAIQHQQGAAETRKAGPAHPRASCGRWRSSGILESKGSLVMLSANLAVSRLLNFSTCQAKVCDEICRAASFVSRSRFVRQPPTFTRKSTLELRFCPWESQARCGIRLVRVRRSGGEVAVEPLAGAKLDYNIPILHRKKALARPDQGMDVACFLSNTYLKSLVWVCERAGSSLLVGTYWIM